MMLWSLKQKDIYTVYPKWYRGVRRKVKHQTLGKVDAYIGIFMYSIVDFISPKNLRGTSCPPMFKILMIVV